MKEYSLLRYGSSTEQHLVAVEEDGQFKTFIKLFENWRTKELTTQEIGKEYPPLSFNDIDNSTGTDAEKTFVLGDKTRSTTTHIANPFKLPTLRDVIEVADYERNIYAMQYPHAAELALAALTHRLVMEWDAPSSA